MNMRMPREDIVLALLLAVMGLLLCRFRVEAAVRGTEQVFALRIQCKPEGKPMEDVVFQLYHLANKRNGRYVLKRPYAATGLESSLLDEDAVGVEVTEMLESFVQREGIEADYETETNEYGQAVVEDMETGVYLALSDTSFRLSDGSLYTPVPFLFYLDGTRKGKTEHTARSTMDAYTVLTKVEISGRTSSVTGNGTSGRIQSPAGGTGKVEIGKGPVGSEEGDSLDEIPEAPIEEIPEEGVPLTGVSPEEEELSSPPVPRSWQSDSPMPQTGLLWWPAPIGFFLGSSMACLGRRKLRQAEEEEAAGRGLASRK